ncbi:hypothetical protein BOTBODRAFT_297258 [Botryobasidium botryosum FD-172 SS1]|uniref:Uncharacterized protein n=1 Tax=Botryobasidium botryosum (strain FD-172 SS1) TaxID=930990 RepID=A0A067MHN4_BOTB1|nr:hypothetical protein BOTBODRAFT_297258 [Botryobasidium botryosum FD-172 SS1]
MPDTFPPGRRPTSLRLRSSKSFSSLWGTVSSKAHSIFQKSSRLSTIVDEDPETFQAPNRPRARTINWSSSLSGLSRRRAHTFSAVSNLVARGSAARFYSDSELTESTTAPTTPASITPTLDITHAPNPSQDQEQDHGCCHSRSCPNQCQNQSRNEAPPVILVSPPSHRSLFAVYESDAPWGYFEDDDRVPSFVPLIPDFPDDEFGCWEQTHRGVGNDRFETERDVYDASIPAPKVHLKEVNVSKALPQPPTSIERHKSLAARISNFTAPKPSPAIHNAPRASPRSPKKIRPVSLLFAKDNNRPWHSRVRDSKRQGRPLLTFDEAEKQSDENTSASAGQGGGEIVGLVGAAEIREDIEKQLKASAVAATSRRNFLAPRTKGSSSSSGSSDETTDATAGYSDSDIDRNEAVTDDYMNTLANAICGDDEDESDDISKYSEIGERANPKRHAVRMSPDETKGLFDEINALNAQEKTAHQRLGQAQRNNEPRDEGACSVDMSSERDGPQPRPPYHLLARGSGRKEFQRPFVRAGSTSTHSIWGFC